MTIYRNSPCLVLNTLSARHLFVHDKINFAILWHEVHVRYQERAAAGDGSLIDWYLAQQPSNRANCRKADAHHGRLGSDLQVEVVHEKF
ncbi:MAG: hypothetical protein IPK39_12960 [Sulfuritalea sp.]|nr:hypothetical protein [Sulfuritalea sp.]